MDEGLDRRLDKYTEVVQQHIEACVHYKNHPCKETEKEKNQARQRLRRRRASLLEAGASMKQLDSCGVEAALNAMRELEPNKQQ